MPGATIDAPAPPKLFLSFAGVDREKAERLAHELAERGVAASWSDQSVQPGEPWAARIGAAIGQADAVAFLLSGAASDSPWIAREIGYAMASSPPKRVIPVLLEPGIDLPPFLGHLRYVDLTTSDSWRSGVDSLVAAAKAQAPSRRDLERELEMRRRMLEAEHAALWARQQREYQEYARKSARLVRTLGLLSVVATIAAAAAIMTRLVRSDQLVAYVTGAVSVAAVGAAYGFYRAYRR